MLQTYGWDKIRFDQSKKNFHLKSTCCSFQKKKKTSRLFYHFQDFTPIFRTFSRSGQISRLFQELKTLYEPCYNQEWLEKCWPAHTVPKADIHDLGIVVKKKSNIHYHYMAERKQILFSKWLTEDYASWQDMPVLFTWNFPFRSHKKKKKIILGHIINLV